MKFKVKFGAINGYAVRSTRQRSGGLDLLDRAREEVNAKFDPKLFKGVEGSWCLQPEIEITEEMARDAGHFREESEILVKVPEGYCDQFQKLELVCKRDKQNDAILYIGFREIVSRNALECAWMEAGYPLEWGFSNEEEE